MDKTLKNERLAYGYGRVEKDFAALRCDRFFLDFKGTKRQARFELLHQVGLRPGDVVCVVRESDLGFGVELKQVRELIVGAGAGIEAAPGIRGAPTKATTRGMADDVKAYARRYWRPGVSLQTINDALARKGADLGDDAGKWGPFTRSQFKHALGAKGAAR